MRPLPKEYVLLRKINSYIEDYFSQPENFRVARSTDIYDYLKRKADIKLQITSGAHFNHFMKEMHNRGVLTQFIKNVKVDTTNKDFFQWYFYPPQKTMTRVTTSADVNVATSHDGSCNFYKWNKKHEASNGTMVRSIEELNILNRLLAVDFFDVHYERPLVAGGMEKVPDFTIFNTRTNTVFYWEHFGMLNNVEYHEKMSEKIEWYKRIGCRSIDEGGRFVISLYRNEKQFVATIEAIIERLKTISIPTGFLR